MKPSINIQTGEIYYNGLVLSSKMENLPLLKKSSLNGLMEFTLNQETEYYFQIFVKENKIQEVLIEFIGTSNSWDEYMKIKDERKDRIEEVLLTSNLKKNVINDFQWGNIKYIYVNKF